MNNYVKIKVKYIAMVCAILFLTCGIGGYYIWCSYHPDISIQVSDSSAGQNLKIQAPHISFSGRHGIEPAASVSLDIANVWIEHETVCRIVKDNYITSDIKLKMEVKNNQTIFKYYGTATNLNGENVDFEKEDSLDLVLNAEITYR